MLIGLLRKNIYSRKVIYKIGAARARDTLKRVQPFLNKKNSILDIGCGVCNVCEILLNRGFKITPLDVQNVSFVDSIKPVLYDGNKIPFQDNEFNTSLLITVLHHTPKPEKILQEAKRVSENIIIVEDVYVNWLHKHITNFFDSLLNLEFVGHPHSNKSDSEWKKLFAELGLEVVAVKYHYFLVFKHAIYYLKRQIST